ncbi:hypothetical protein ACFC00_12700 [Streptomyces adustus]|uniref:hypothetical protein n=1 Tax=Streptomyces adustus TaxID=1609272 RepID=UPI0035E2165C
MQRPHSGSGVFAIVAELASRLEAVIFEPSEGVFLCGTEAHAHLPGDMREEAALIEMTGDAVEAALIGPRPLGQGRPGKGADPPDSGA